MTASDIGLELYAHINRHVVLQFNLTLTLLEKSVFVVI